MGLLSFFLDFLSVRNSTTSAAPKPSAIKRLVDPFPGRFEDREASDLMEEAEEREENEDSLAFDRNESLDDLLSFEPLPSPEVRDSA